MAEPVNSVCSVCGAAFDRKNKYGICTRTKQCRHERSQVFQKNNVEHNRERNKRWVADNADRRKAVRQAWRERNREAIRQKKRDYAKRRPDVIKAVKERHYQRHRESVLAANKEYREKNRATCIASARRWALQNPERRRRIGAEWKKRNPDNVKLHNEKRRARKAGTLAERFYHSEIFERDQWVCQRCGRKTKPGTHKRNPLHPNLDHIIPISKGGSHTRDNVQCLCHECNWKKNNRVGGDQLILFG